VVFTKKFGTVAVALVALASAAAVALAGGEVQWTRQFGSPAFDAANGVAVDATGAYVTGHTLGTLPGQTSSGGADALVRKYDSNGNELWTRQFGTAADDLGIKLAADGSSVYVTGWTLGALAGQSSAGRFDTYVRRYDTNGNELWTRQFGTPASDVSFDIAVHSSGIYVLGKTRGTFPGQTNQGGFDLYLAKLDHDRNLVWVREFGSTADDPPVFIGGSVAVNDSGVFVASSLGGPLPGETSLGGDDGFVRKYDFGGNVLWTRVISTPCDDVATAGAVSGGHVFVAGQTLGNLDKPDSAPCSASPNVMGLPVAASGGSFVRRYDDDGTLVWTTALHPRSGFLDPEAMAAGPAAVYIGGEVFRGVDEPNPGPGDPACPRRAWFQDSDVYVTALSLSGEPEWSNQFGTNGLDVPTGLAIGLTGLYASGSTECALAGQTSAGDFDAFLVKLSP
jgi:hypothetical protein